MKKSLALITALVMALTLLTACGKGEPENVLADKSLEEILAAVYEEHTPEFPLVDVPVDLSDETAAAYYTGLSKEDSGKVKEALASESAMGSQAYSLVLLRLNDAADADSIASAVKDGIDPRKWICVEADDLRVSAHGDVVMLAMISSEFADSVTAEQLTESFKNVAGGSLSVDLE